jgi:organic radical activating enzyme
MENKNLASYTSANIFPVKVLLNKDIISDSGKIRPSHVHVNPTNLCNLDCHFCSCKKRNKTKEIDLDLLKEIMWRLAVCGCKAVTITGGGEPCLYTHVNELVDFAGNNLFLKIGFVSNGISLNRIETYSNIEWLRISHSDYRPFDKKYQDKLEKAISSGQSVDWAFSYVVTAKPNFETMAKVIQFANEHDFTHVRLVPDLINLDNIPDMAFIKKEMRNRNVNDSIVIYQGRKQFVRGRSKCLISLLKPVVGADGLMYPCCGAQCAKTPPAYDYDATMCMGAGLNIEEIYQKQQYFDGSGCTTCYYDEYNVLLNKLITPISHKEFV